MNPKKHSPSCNSCKKGQGVKEIYSIFQIHMNPSDEFICPVYSGCKLFLKHNHYRVKV